MVYPKTQRDPTSEGMRNPGMGTPGFCTENLHNILMLSPRQAACVCASGFTKLARELPCGWCAVATTCTGKLDQHGKATSIEDKLGARPSAVLHTKRLLSWGSTRQNTTCLVKVQDRVKKVPVIF